MKAQATRALLCLTSLAALSVSPLRETAAVRAVLPFGVLWALGLFGLWQLYGAWLRLPPCPRRYPLLLLSALFAAILVLGQSYVATGTAAYIAEAPIRSLLMFIGRVPLCCTVMTLLQNALLNPSPPVERFKTCVPYAAALLLCWLPYLYFIFPGTVSNDSVTQVLEIIGVEPLGNANPIFQTALIYLFRGFGAVVGNMDAGVFLYCGLQALLMAWLLGALVCGMAKDGAPRWLTVGAFLFFAFCPVFPLFAFCMGKDTNFSMAVLWLSMLALRLIRSDAKPRPIQTLCLCLAAVLCALLRNPGVYLAAGTLIVLLLWTLPRRGDGRWIAPAAALASVAVVYGALQLFVLPGFSVAPMPDSEHLSVPLQQTARVAACHGLTQEEAAAMSGALDTAQLAGAYNGEISDPVKLLWNANATDAQKASFFRVWRGLLLKYPGTCMSAVFHNAYGYLYPGYMSTIKPTLLIGRQKSANAYTEAAFPYSVNPRADKLLSFFNRLAENPLYRIAVAPGLYGLLCLFAVCVLVRRKSGRLLIPALPALFSLAGCLMSAVNGYFRYAMPLYMCAPLLLWLCAQQTNDAKERD